MHLLIINYDFPPAGGAGIKRCLKFMKFLPLHDWYCTVITVRNGNHTATDTSLLNDISPDVSVIRAPTLESLVMKGNSSFDENQREDSNNAKSIQFPMQYIWKTYKFFGKFLKIPDSRVLWLPSALVAALSIHRKDGFDAIYATGPTFVNLIAGAILKSVTGKPLVCDFRDAWISDPMNSMNANNFRFKLQNKLESFVVKKSDLVIATNSFVTDDFRKRYKTQLNEKFVTIYNGYDTDDSVSMTSAVLSFPKEFTFVYTGILYGERTPKYFLEALKLAITEKPSIRNCVKVIFVGVCKVFFDGNTIEDYIRQYDLSNVVVLTGHVTRRKSLEYQKLADCLLLLVGIVPAEKELTYGISGKIFDYLLSGKPVVTLANGGATREFIVENKIGEIFYHHDIASIKNYIINACEKRKAVYDNDNRVISEYPQFNFRHLTGKLAAHLNRITKSTASQES